MTVKIISNDKKIIEIDTVKAKKFLTLKNLIDDIGEELTEAIPLDISYNVLVEIFNDNIRVEIDDKLLFDMLIAVNLLDNQELLDRLAEKIANIIKSYDNPEDLRKRFNIKCDFEGEELEQIKRETEALKSM